MNFYALIAPAAIARLDAPAIIGSSHDPLIGMALREGRCGLASFH
jgi:hypothetical protein